MNGGLVETLRREHARLRWSLVNVCSLTVLAVLAASFLVPRSYVSEAVLGFSVADAGSIPATAERLRSLAAGRHGGIANIQPRGRELVVGVQSDDPAQARPELKSLLDSLMADARQAQLGALDAQAKRLARAVDAAKEQLAAARKATADALAVLPAGGNAAAAARLGKLQAESDGLALEIRDGRRHVADLEARVEELGAEIDGARPDAAAVDALERQLKEAQGELGRAVASGGGDAAKAHAHVEALEKSLTGARATLDAERSRQAGLVARRESAQEELANRRRQNEASERRAAQLEALVEEARKELVRLEGENAQIQQLGKTESAAERTLSDAEDEAARHAASVERARERPDLPFTLSVPPGEPRLAAGFAAWQYVLIGVAAGVAGSLAALLLHGLRARDSKSLARLAEQLQVKALVELPVWRDPIVDAGARRRRARALSLLVFSAASCAVYLRFA